MPQLDYQDQSDLQAFEGGLYDSGPNDVVSRTPGGNVKQLSTLTIGAAPTAAVAQVATFTVDTAADADNFVITVAQFEFTGVSSGTDATAQALAIANLMNANEDFQALYTAVAAAADIVVTALRPGTPFHVDETVDATSAYSWVEETTANTDGTQFKITIDGIELLYAAASAVITTERDALLALLQADTSFATEVVFAAESTDAITIEALVAGNPHTITFENEDGIGRAGVSASETFVATTANVTGNPIPFGRGLARSTTEAVTELPSATGFVLEGISVNRAKARPKVLLATGPAEYNSDEAVPVLRKGRIWVKVEDAVTLTSGVFVRHTQGADSLHTVGRFRGADVPAEVDEVTSGARWVIPAGVEGLAMLEFDLMASATT